MQLATMSSHISQCGFNSASPLRVLRLSASVNLSHAPERPLVAASTGSGGSLAGARRSETPNAMSVISELNHANRRSHQTAAESSLACHQNDGMPKRPFELGPRVPELGSDDDPA